MRTRLWVPLAHPDGPSPLAAPCAAHEPARAGAASETSVMTSVMSRQPSPRARSSNWRRPAVLDDRYHTCGREDDNGCNRVNTFGVVRARWCLADFPSSCDDARGTSRGPKSRVSRQKQLMGARDMMSLKPPNTACDLSRANFIRDAFRARRRADGDARERA